jgi:hypothetical protein
MTTARAPKTNDPMLDALARIESVQLRADKRQEAHEDKDERRFDDQGRQINAIGEKIQVRLDEFEDKVDARLNRLDQKVDTIVTTFTQKVNQLDMAKARAEGEENERTRSRAKRNEADIKRSRFHQIAAPVFGGIAAALAGAWATDHFSEHHDVTTRTTTTGTSTIDKGH